MACRRAIRRLGTVISLIQRVLKASVVVDGDVVGEIEHGLLVFVGVERGDTAADADATARKIGALRVFPGRTPTDLAVGEVGGGCLVVSQFTLAAELRHGNRPDFTAAAAPRTPKRSTGASPSSSPAPACALPPGGSEPRCRFASTTTARSRWC